MRVGLAEGAPRESAHRLPYDPATSPFDLPVTTLRVACRSERPVTLTTGSGTFPSVALTGAVVAGLVDLACERRAPSARCGLARDSEPRCAAPDSCPVGRVLKPHCAVTGRDHASAVRVRSHALDAGAAVSEFEVEVRLIGRRAGGLEPLVLAAVERGGELGLDMRGGRVRFAPTRLVARVAGPLGERIDRSFPGADVQQAALAFETPTLFEVNVARGGRRSERLLFADGPLPLAAMLDRAAYDLVTWDVEDRGLGIAAPRSDRDSWGLALAARAVDASRKVTIDAQELAPIDLDERTSRSDGRTYPVQGFTGRALIGGDVRALWPFLVVAAVVGVGKRRAAGFGFVSIALVSGTGPETISRATSWVGGD